MRALLAASLAGWISVAVHAQTQVATLSPFTGISVCTPFNVMISPSPAGATVPYALFAQATQDVKAAINATVAGGVLYLSTTSGAAPSQLSFNTSSPIEVTVSLPANQLAAVSVSSIPSITVAVGTGFSVAGVAASLTGTSSLSFLGITVGSGATILNSGTGAVVMLGQLPSVVVTSAGTGSVYLQGTSGPVTVDASGITNVYISGSATTATSGQVSGLSSVQYSAGTCSIASQFAGVLASACTQTPVTIPPQNPQWTCGLLVYGSFGCSGSSAGVATGSTSSSTGGGTSVSTTSSVSGTATASASSNGNTQTSESVNGVTTTGGSGGSLVTNTGSLQLLTCPVGTVSSMV